MKHPAWLVELHRQWQKARRRRTTAVARSFSRDWEDLLDAAGLHSAEDRKAAERELEKLQPQLTLSRQRGRTRILKVGLPVASEPWLHALFGTASGADTRQQTLDVVRRHAAAVHPLLPELWLALCARLEAAFAIPRVCGPFHWRKATRVDDLLTLLFQVTGREWPEGTLVRDASTSLGHHSKLIEARQASLKRALTQLFEREAPLEALGIQTSNSVLHYSGPLTLHFADGTQHHSDALRFESALSVAELDRAVRITTTAQRLLTVENRKTTFVQLARADAGRTTLIVATSFPAPAVRRLLEKLPPDLPHHHFGDTDPSGWDIVRDLREVCPKRIVQPFHMHWRPKADAKPLTRCERQTLERLLADPLMADCHASLRQMLESGLKGDHEQETLGAPGLCEWPFYRAASM